MQVYSDYIPALNKATLVAHLRQKSCRKSIS